jgi:hypothetical protein
MATIPGDYARGHGAKPYTLRYVNQNPLARMLPLHRWQNQVYRLGEKLPPSALEGHGPVWEAVTVTLNPRATLQARVNLQRDFTLLSISASSTSNVSGGFRAQLYDLKKHLRLADRGVQFAVFAGTAGTALSTPFFLREPYRFDMPDSQILINVQNLETVSNTVQMALYGLVLRFNEVAGRNFPGGPFTGYDWAAAMQKGPQ